ncbi:MAG: hypothetical protein CMN13_03565 [Roseobacter sp.]|jgi:hypothetical protein|uniref:Uncharacterized protein n=3 Tax=Sulfitobacter TaxID=60136 RepID=A0A1H2RV35_9RHOB|nr:MULTISPECIES: hypothetical protein [Sulfitobacter]MAB16322.1 hypothetical protein [Roseobacter sp.]EAP85110.1 hypothetical protein EE36_04263 [Sulfitobacter sp. EE-36]KAJ29887.1 hypothetical protein PM01_11435 [Sulfitobacter pontiacus 3SOLIMAR09]MAX76951.1 hypothetical protein [Roseobacter sp.]MBG62885.1 hypothetical protein [Roseobacter sp.]|tara:strand:- start:92 stop:619 length:528 start_codon:yes stop_codon:yes gene_type:complete
MSFLRPEAKAELWRWREVLGGIAVALIGLWLVAGPGLLLAIPGYALILAGVIFVWIGGQRVRFRKTGLGAGAVQVDEGQIAYFGPLTGGVIALREMERLSLERGAYPAHWKLEQPGQNPVMIPVDAAGADALFDAFAALPGLRTERMLAELADDKTLSVVIWERRSMRPASTLLH